MNRLVLASLAAVFLITSCSTGFDKTLIELESASLKVSINKRGEISNLVSLSSGENYLAPDTSAAVMSIRLNGEILPPLHAGYSENHLSLEFNDSIEARIRIEELDSHLVFELVSITGDSLVDLIIWGPYPTRLNKVIGETVGVVQGAEYALGIQSLNPKTLGGYPWNENDCMPQIDIFEQDDYSDISEVGKRYVLYRVEAAKPANFGSTLQAYCRKRSRDRIIENWNHDHYLAPAYNDGGYIGSKVAIFGCPVDQVLDHIEEIEIAEELPHPMIKGQWGKTAAKASSAYIILDFGEENIEEAISLTKQAGLNYLYLGGPFKNWGHFQLKEKRFPNGYDGLKACISRANKEGIDVGIHTLSNFISTDDPYISPQPDQRLAKVGSSVLTENVGKHDTELAIESPIFFNQYRNNNLKTVMIGQELIRYGSVSESEPWKLLDCQRGAFNTQMASHTAGAEVSKLADHGYKVFLTNPELSIEVAKNIAELFNQTGLRQISFDGLEGNRSTGMGNYGEVLFTKAWYDHLNEDIRKDFIADASRTSHYFWHIYTRMNWGEPWYDDFRESQTEYRLKNQKYFKRNLMPAMLGWFLMKPGTSIEDIEWLLARSAAFNAGYAFVTSFDAVEKNANSDKILELLGTWEEARMQGLFSEAQKTRMEDIRNEFILRKSGAGTWILQEVFSGKYQHLNNVRQPGEPLYTKIEYENKGPDQHLGFILTSTECSVSGIKLEIDNYRSVHLPFSLNTGEHLKYEGGKYARIYSSNWQIIKEIELDPADFYLTRGKHTVSVDCEFDGGNPDSMLKLELRTLGEEETLTSVDKNE